MNDILYFHNRDSILRHCLTHEEAEFVLNDCHSRACGGHLSRLATAQKILHAGYFWPSISKYCTETVNKCPPCQMFTTKKCTYPSPLHPGVAVGPFSKWGIDFMHCRPTSAKGHGYIILAVDYFTKWDETMPTYSEDGKIVLLFLFNHIIARFRIPMAIMTDHGSHFQNKMMV